VLDTSPDKKVIWLAPLLAFMSIFVFCVTYCVYFYARQRAHPAGFSPALVGTAIFVFFNLGLTSSLLSAGAVARHLLAVVISGLFSGACFLFLLNVLIINTLGSW